MLRWPFWSIQAGSTVIAAERNGAGNSIAARPSAEAGVDPLQRRRARAELLLAERVERRRHRVEVAVEVFRLLVDIEKPGDHLALGALLLQEAHRREAVVD